MSAILYYFLQMTWGLALNLTGSVIFMFLKGERHFRYQHALVRYWNIKACMAIGMFIFLEKDLEEEEPRLLYHEYGHTVQSAVLGLLYLPLIALPSVIWANSRKMEEYRKKTGRSYYSFYPEKWADHAGLKALKKAGHALDKRFPIDRTP